MIFVAVGNATQGFTRLLTAIDRLAAEGFFGGELVFVQTGSNVAFRSNNCQSRALLTIEEFRARIREASVIISHGGAGTLFHIFDIGKIPVVMPRRRKYGELIDDHQVELVEALTAEGRVIPAYEAADLKEAVWRVRGIGSGTSRRADSRMVGLISKAIDELVGAGRSRGSHDLGAERYGPLHRLKLWRRFRLDRASQ